MWSFLINFSFEVAVSQHYHDLICPVLSYTVSQVMVYLSTRDLRYCLTVSVAFASVRGENGP